MSVARGWAVALVGGWIVGGAPQLLAQQNGANPHTPTLEEQVKDLAQQVRILQRLREIAADSAAAAAKDR